MTGPAVVALAAGGLLTISAAFQLGLCLGAPWAAAAYGGRATRVDGRLPIRYRIASLVTAIVLTLIGWLLLVKGSVLPSGPLADAVVTGAVWTVAALFALNTVGNLAGRHPVERWGLGGITAGLTVLCVLLAVSP
jgi:uncharacterized membrane protein YhdT